MTVHYRPYSPHLLPPNYSEYATERWKLCVCVYQALFASSGGLENDRVSMVVQLVLEALKHK